MPPPPTHHPAAGSWLAGHSVAMVFRRVGAPCMGGCHHGRMTWRRPPRHRQDAWARPARPLPARPLLAGVHRLPVPGDGRQQLGPGVRTQYHPSGAVHLPPPHPPLKTTLHRERHHPRIRRPHRAACTVRKGVRVLLHPPQRRCGDARVPKRRPRVARKRGRRLPGVDRSRCQSPTALNSASRARQSYVLSRGWKKR